MENEYKKALKEVLMNLRCIDTTENKQVESYVDNGYYTIAYRIQDYTSEKMQMWSRD